MVRKLLKHEFIALGRIILPTAGAVVALALLSSLTALITQNTAAETVSIALFGLLVVSVCVIIAMAYVLCIKRFHDSLFSKQGYMTLSLPVTPMQLLWTKLLSSLAAMFFCFLVALAAAELYGLIQGVNVVATVAEYFLYYLSAMEEAGMAIQGSVIAYGLVVGFVGLVSSLLFIFACASAGQLVSKNRSWLQVGVFIGVGWIYSTLWEFISNIALGAYYNGAGFEAAAIYTGSSYLTLSLSLVKELILGVASVFFIRYILKNKVNLLA